jgi:hypothetical protein
MLDLTEMIETGAETERECCLRRRSKRTHFITGFARAFIIIQVPIIIVILSHSFDNLRSSSSIDQSIVCLTAESA